MSEEKISTIFARGGSDAATGSHFTVAACRIG